MTNNKLSIRKLSRTVAACALAGAALLNSSSAQAAVDCRGKVMGLALHHGGGVIVTIKGSGVSIFESAICTLGVTTTVPGVGNIPAAACDGMYSALLAAMLSGRDVTLSLYTGSSCNIPSFASLSNSYGYYYLRSN